MSDRLDLLAEHHPLVSEALINISGSVRNTATLLEVLVATKMAPLSGLEKSPSFWIKGIHITLQFAELGGMWVSISFDGIATVRFLGRYTLAGHNIRVPDSLSTAPTTHGDYDTVGPRECSLDLVPRQSCLQASVLESLWRR